MMRAGEPVADGTIQPNGGPVDREWRADLLRRFAWLLCVCGTPLVLYLTVAPAPFGPALRPVQVAALLLIPLAALAVATGTQRHVRSRGTVLILALLFLGGVAVRYWGPAPGALLCLLLAAVLATLLIGRRAGLLALVLGAASLLAFGWAGRLQTAPFWAVQLQETSTWLRMTFTYLLLTGAVQLLVSGAVRRVESSLSDTRAALAESDRERRARGEAERAARENAERLREALDAAEMGTWDWDVATGGVTWTGYAAVLLGIPPGAPAHDRDVSRHGPPGGPGRSRGRRSPPPSRAPPTSSRSSTARAASPPRWLLGPRTGVPRRGRPAAAHARARSRTSPPRSRPSSRSASRKPSCGPSCRR